MNLAAILAVLARLLDWLMDRKEQRHEAELENEVRDDIAKDAKIRDLERAADIDRRVDAILDGVRRGDGDTSPAGDGRGQFSD